MKGTRRLSLVALLLAAACAAPAPQPEAFRVIATPVMTAPTTPVPTAVPTPVPTLRPTVRPAPRVQAVVRPAPRPSGDLAAFRGLGAWVDVFDHNNDPATVLPLIHAMAKQGTRTLYIETSRYKETTAIKFPVALGAALDEAKRLGMRVVGWYPPAFGDMERDVAYTLAGIRFRSPGGHRFDAFAPDIEYPGEVPDPAKRSALAVEYSRRIRAAAGPNYVLAAIVIPPSAYDRDPTRWPGFPWGKLSPLYQVFMPMNYWTGRSKDAATASKLTTENTVRTRALTGRPVHNIGGLGEDTDEAQALAYVKAALGAGSLGGGLYDYKTTHASVWDELRLLKSLSTDTNELIVRTVREFVDREVTPVASRFDHDDVYPSELVEQLGAMGFFGATIPQEYGGMGLDFVTYARCVEEVCRGFMSLSGVFNTHLICAYIVRVHGTDEQRERWLPLLASGERRAGLALTEPGCGSDLQAITTVARRTEDAYVVRGRKMFITNGEQGDVFATLVKTNPDIDPSHRGMSCLLVSKGEGFTISNHIDKLGYRAVDTVELVLDDVRVPASDLVGAEEGHGFEHAMDGLETGRINIAARAVGVAQAAFDAAIRYAQERHTFGRPIAEHQAIQFMLAEMGTQIEAGRLLYLRAAELKDAGERADLEAGMAKLFASEMCREVALSAMRVHGGYGYSTEFPVERYYRDAPLMIIGEGTNEIQRLVIARRLLERYSS